MISKKLIVSDDMISRVRSKVSGTDKSVGMRARIRIIEAEIAELRLAGYRWQEIAEGLMCLDEFGCVKEHHLRNAHSAMIRSRLGV